MERTKKLAHVGLLSACLIAPVSSISADVLKEGKYDVHAGCSGPLQLLSGVKDNIGGSYLATCLADAPAGAFFNGVVVQCAGSWTLISGKYEEHGMCESTDQSGDKFFGVFSKNGEEDGTWRVTGGTGKYEGMDQSGKFNLAVQIPALPGQLGGIFHWWGNYKMR